jgi:hypothetical protein
MGAAGMMREKARQEEQIRKQARLAARKDSLNGTKTENPYNTVTRFTAHRIWQRAYKEEKGS